MYRLVTMHSVTERQRQTTVSWQ